MKKSSLVNTSLNLMFLAVLFILCICRIAVAATISGTITNNSAAGISGVVVTVFNSTNLVGIKTVTTDANGNYIADEIPLGSYKILFYAQESGYDNAWYSGRSNSSNADTIVVSADTTFTANAILSAGIGGSISGQVTNSIGSGIPGVWVAAGGGGPSPFFVFGTTTNSNGNYTINGLSSGPYKLQFQGGNVGYQNLWYNGATSSDAASIITVTQPNQISGINATLTLAGGMSGRVTNQAGIGLANVDVVLSDPVSNLWLARATTDTNGNFTVTGLLGRDYKVRFDGSTIDYGRQWYNAKVDFASATTVAVTPPSITTGINAVLPTGGILSGRVINGTTGLAGVTITVKDAVTGDWIVNDKTDGSGAYMIRGLNTGTYKVQYVMSGYTTKWYNGKSNELSADSVSITAPGITTLSDVSLSASTTITITGNVMNSSGSAISTAIIEMVGNPSLATTSQADGTFTLSGLPAGAIFSLKISKAGYVPTYSRNYTLSSDPLNPMQFNLLTADNIATWGGTPGKGYIRGRVMASYNGGTGYLINAIVTASSSLHPESPYPVYYNDGVRYGGSQTFANSIYLVINVDPGDTVTLSVNRPGVSFEAVSLLAHGDGVSQSSVIGTTVAPGDFPIATTTEREIGFSGAFDGSNYLVGIEGLAAGHPSHPDHAVTAQFISQSGSLVGSRINIGRTGSTPLVEFDGTNYLLVWGDDGISDNIIIYGQLVSTSGVLIGTPFPISQTLSMQRRVGRVLFDGHNYFVVWEQRSDPSKSSTADIFGQFVTKTGALLGQPLTISNAPYGQRGPVMAYDGTSFLAIWEDGRNQSACYTDVSGTLCPESDIYGQFITGSSEVAPGALSGNNIPISLSPLPRDNPVGIAFDGTNYLITFHELNALPSACPTEGCHWNLYAQFVTQSGIPTGSRITISNAPGNHHFPFPAFDGLNYLITWTDGLGGPAPQVTTRGRFLDKSGIFTSPECILFTATAEGRIPWMTTLSGRSKGGYTILVNWGTPGTNQNDFSSYTNADVYGAFITRNSNVEIPSISGTPSTTATVDSAYSFTPIASNVGSFSITGSVPPGLNFNTMTGTLSGTPTTSDTYSNIIITVTNSSGSASLPAFTITVNPPSGIIPYITDTNTVLLDHFDGSSNASILAYEQNGQACGPSLPTVTPNYSYVSGPNGLNKGLILNPPAGMPESSATYLLYPGGQLLSQANGTIEFWVYLTSWDVGLFDQGPYYGSCMGWTFGLVVLPTGQLQASAWDAFIMDSGTTTVPLNSWTHVATTWGSAGAKLYINGMQVGSDANTGMPASGFGGSLLARLGTSTGSSVSIDELRVSNIQRTTFNIPPPPTISGTPSTIATVGNAYNFTPTATIATSFSITGNIPPGLNFNSTSGTLSGTPTTVGTFSNIGITATNSSGSTSLPAFTITVNFSSDPVNGQCGYSNGQMFATQPTTNYCTDGVASPVTVTGLFTWGWACLGRNGGTDANCSATMLNYNIIFESSGNGTIVGITNQTIGYGGSTTAVTANPNPGYRFVNWTGTGGFITTSNNPLTIDNITTSRIITANFDTSNTWQETGGPVVGPFMSIAIDPTNSQTIYVGTLSNSVFKSTNGGNSWVAVNTGLSSAYVHALAIDSTSSQTIYAGTMGGGIFKSTNGGNSWISMNSELGSTYVYTLAIDPTNSQTIYAGTSRGIFKSTNGGNSWITVNSGLTSMYVYTLTIDPTNSQTIYVGTSDGGVFKSTNGGDAWNSVNSGLQSLRIFSLVIDPTNSQIIYAGTYGGGVFKSTSGGGSWSVVNSGMTNSYIWSLAIDPTNNHTIYAETIGGGVFKSISGGNSWIAMNSGLADMSVNTLAIDTTSSQTIYAGTDSGLFKSTSGGDSWSAVNSGLTGTYIRSLAIDPTNNQTIYAGTTGGGVFKSTNGATNSGYPWNAFTIWSIRTMVSSLVIDPANSQTIYAGAWNEGVFKSTNGGNSWNAVNSGLTSTDVRALAIDPTNSQIIYAATFGGGLFKSTNGGSSWSAVNSGLASTHICALAIDPINSQTIYAGTSESGVFKSTNGGSSWSAVNSGLTSTNIHQTLTIDSTNSQIIYVGTFYGGVFKSTNGGNSWSAVNSGLTNKEVESLAIDPSNSQTIYIGTWNSGVFKSTNGGVSWRAINSGLTNLCVVSLAIDPTNSQTLYAGTYGGGVFKGFSRLDVPTISASTPTTANVGTAYSFTPISTDAASFSITGNIPPGLTFNTATGSLSGIPTTVGIYNNLVITVTNARGSALLPAFTITVNPPMPTITGAPPTTATVGRVYSFVPTATNTTSFSITNLPSWANFNTPTGSLTGTPTIADTGTFSNIIISATNNTETVSLSAFSITVNLGTISGTPPTIAIVGTEYSFIPTATNATSFSITNMPSWATFNTTTGALTGTPTITDTGTYSNITISATNSNATVSLPEFNITVTQTMPTITWQQTGGPTGGNVTSLIIDPTSNQTIYAGTYIGVFKSTDGGSSWSKLNNGLSSLTVQTLAIDPTNSQTIYAGTLGGVFKSNNGGSSWSAMNSGLTGTYLYVYSLAIDPANSQTIYAGTYSGVFKSNNGASSWSAMNSGLTGTFLNVNLLAIDPSNSQTIYAGLINTGVFKSTNGGVSWSVVNSGLTSLDVRALAIDPTSSQTIYAGTSGGVLKSSNGGITWSVLESGFTKTYIRSLAIDPTNSQTIYAGTLGGGVIKFINGGSFWGALKNGMINTSVNTLAIDPTSSQTIYAGTHGGGVSKSINYGSSWIEASSGLMNGFIRSLVIDPASSLTIYAGTSGGVFKSTNGSSSWIDVNSGLTSLDVRALAIDPTNSQIIYAGTWVNGGIFKSTNGGSSWIEINSGLIGAYGYSYSIYSLAIDPANSQTIYAGTYTTGVFKSINGGSSWSAVNNGLTDLHICALVIDPISSQTIYAGTYDDGVFKSTDGGSSWIAVNNGLANTYICTLAIDPTRSQTIYAGTLGGVFKSTNGGTSWISMNSGLTGTYAITLVIDPTNSQNIYAGTASGGVFKGLPGLVKTGSISIFPPSPFHFGNVPVGGSSPMQIVTVTNDTPGVLNILSSSGSGDISQFVFQSGGTNPCPSFPTNLNTNQSCTLSATFAPTLNGAMEATIDINSDAPNLPTFPIILRGTGIIGDTTTPVTTATPNSGTYTSQQRVSLATNEAATIYFTIDGSNPETSATKQTYTSQINIATTTTLRFYAVDKAGNREQVKTNKYTITNSWAPAAPMPAARYGAAAGVINGILYVAGGNDGAHETSTLQVYEPVSNAWSSLATMPEGRYGGNGATVIDNRLYVAGGWDNTYAWIPHDNLWAYNPVTNIWEIKSAMPLLSACGASVAINGKLYVTTACDGSSGYKNYIHMYDPATDRWSSMASSPTAHGNPAYGVINGKILLAGGIDSSDNFTSQMDIYDPESNSWTTKAPLPVSGEGFSSGVIDGKLYVAGGRNNIGQFLKSVYVYDPDADKWSAMSSMPTPRGSAATGVINGLFYVAGGSNDSGVLALTEVYTQSGYGQSSSPTISGFSPTVGLSGMQVTITGSNFDPVAANNVVQFNGVATPTVYSTVSTLIVNVPTGATTGRISVTTPSGTATSGSDFTITYKLTVNITGWGTVTEINTYPTLSCINPPNSFCEQQYAQIGQLGLTATPSSGYEFQGWGGACSSYVSNSYCALDMVGDTSVSTLFALMNIIRIGPVKYPSIQAAVDVAANNDVIMLRDMDFQEIITVNNSGITMTLKGGLDVNFNPTSGFSVFNKLIIRGGKVIVYKIKLH